jgi:hypothetical protein
MKHIPSALIIAVAAGAAALSFAQGTPAPRTVPAIHSNVAAAPDGQLTVKIGDGPVYTQRDRPAAWTLDQLRGSPHGTATGIAFDFAKPGFTGSLVYGLIPYGEAKYPQPVFRTTTPVKDGKTEIDVKTALGGTYDMVGWKSRGRGVVGYRLIGPDGQMLHDGRVAFKGTGPFEVDLTLLEGPFVANVTDRGAVVWFELDRTSSCEVRVAPTPNPKVHARAAEKTFPCRAGSAHQEVALEGLSPATDYRYTVRYGDAQETYGFRTAPRPGSRRSFAFGYTSDSRGGVGGGERNLAGPNAHMMRRIMALAADRRLAFLQFTGDLVTGSGDSPAARLMELANWKATMEPQGHWLPVYTGLGNHEAILRDFAAPDGQLVRLPRFPFATESTEAIFAKALVNPTNGPASEDGSAYDPDPTAIDFPSYRENVYSYTHGNVAMVVLNSNYWYSSSVPRVPQVGGNPTGYLMDAQMKWLGEQLDAFERNAAIDHVFLTVHTPVFPNGGHVNGSMYYGGNNEARPWVAGRPVARGMMERRTDLLRLMHAHRKVLAVLTGDEHNYNRLRVGPDVPIYPEGWKGDRIVVRRPFYQINNGAAGAPYYAQDRTPPWSAHVKGFSAQNALCLFRVEGPRVRLEVINPETLEVIDRAVLR